MSSASSYQDICSRLHDVKRKENRLSLLHGLMLAFLGIAGFLLTVVVLEQLFLFSVSVRTIVVICTVLWSAALAGWFVVRPLLRMAGILKSAGRHELAEQVGVHFPQIRDRLIDALDLHENRGDLQNYYSEALIDASLADLYEAIRPLDFTVAVSTAGVRRMRRITLYGVLLILLVGGISPVSFVASFERLANFGQSFAAPVAVRFTIEPGDAEVVRGENVAVTIRTEGHPVDRLQFYTRPHGQVTFDVQNLFPSQGGLFRTQLSGLRASTEYYAVALDVPSTRYTIRVLDRPLIRTLRVTVTAPAYTRIPPKTLDDNVGDVSVYPGSAIAVRIMASKPVSAASLVFSDSSSVPLAVNGTELSGTFRIRHDCTWHCVLRDTDGLPNEDPVEYSVKVIPDEYPSVEILSPAKNLDLTTDMKVDLLVRIKDDFGFSKLRLAWRLIQSRYEQPAATPTFVDIPLPPGSPLQADIPWPWDCSDLNLVPEDALEYYAEVFDNDNVSGPKSARSQAYIIRLPSLEEVFTDVSKTHDESLESMQSVAQDAEQLRKEIEEFSTEMKTNREKADWQQQQKAGELARRYEEMQKKLDETAGKLDEMVRKMDENKLLSPQTMEKYQELQKLMDQLNSPELRDALRKLQESMKQLSPEQAKQAMEQTKLSEEQFRENLERTIELLKRIHIEQKLDELVKRAQDLKQEQKQLNDKTAAAPSSDQQQRDALSRQQADLQKQVQSLEKETTDLQKKMDEFPKEMPTEEMAKTQEQLARKQIGKKMQQSAAQIQSGDMQAAQKGQQETAQDLNDVAEQMQKTQQALLDRQMKQIVNAMRKQLENVVELSKRQEDLKDRTKNLDPNSQQFRQDAQDQNDAMNDLGKVADQMAEIGKKSFAISPEMAQELGNAMKQMNGAVQQMENRNPGSSSQMQGGAMESLNRAAMMMQGALNSMMSGQSGGMGMAGLMGRLQQMAGAQGQINAGTQQAMGQGLSPEQQADYRRLGTQQSSVQKSLKQLADEAKNSGEYSRLMGDLDKIAQEMKEVQSDLEQGAVNPNTVQKQDRILSRLLESTKSMRERDYEKRRTSESGKNVLRESPADIDLTTQEGKNRLREELLKMMDGKFTRDYEELIRKYFDQLDKKEIQQ